MSHELRARPFNIYKKFKYHNKVMTFEPLEEPKGQKRHPTNSMKRRRGEVNKD
jgi:hypothetical protein